MVAIGVALAVLRPAPAVAVDSRRPAPEVEPEVAWSEAA